jgi:hypothetical protein
MRGLIAASPSVRADSDRVLSAGYLNPVLE